MICQRRALKNWKLSIGQARCPANGGTRQQTEGRMLAVRGIDKPPLRAHFEGREASGLPWDGKTHDLG